MVVANQIKTRIESFPEGYVFSLADFDMDGNSEIALAKLLSRMAAKGEIRRSAKGKYYKPQNTLFGMIGPAYNELVKDFLIKDGIMVGYVTGTAAFSEMGLTTQITQELMIGTSVKAQKDSQRASSVFFIIIYKPFLCGIHKTR